MRDCQTLEAAKLNLMPVHESFSLSVPYRIRFFLDDHIVFLKYPASSPKVDQKHNSYDQHKAESDEVAVRSFELWHVVKVHAVDTRDQCQRENYRGQHGERFHNVIRLVRHNGKMNIKETADQVAIVFGKVGNSEKVVVNIPEERQGVRGDLGKFTVRHTVEDFQLP